MNAEHEDLTPGERRFLERQREADKEGVTLQEYYRAHGLSLPGLYSTRRQLISKGVLAPELAKQRKGSTPPKPPSRFAEVKLSGPVPAAPGRVCRLRSPNGWIIECDGMPDPTWLSGVMGVQS
jgi:hypothetical protein